ncbi:MAG: hypothetical protein HFH70_08105, partial [Lachnospiraceae bacterium]|nr:hypothetical protein [Lachnospiraceae bacterium]
RASAENLKSKAILKELNCPTGRNVSLNFCQFVISGTFAFYRKLEILLSHAAHNESVPQGKIFFISLDLATVGCEP